MTLDNVGPKAKSPKWSVLDAVKFSLLVLVLVLVLVMEAQILDTLGEACVGWETLFTITKQGVCHVWRNGGESVWSLESGVEQEDSPLKEQVWQMTQRKHMKKNPKLRTVIEKPQKNPKVTRAV